MRRSLWLIGLLVVALTIAGCLGGPQVCGSPQDRRRREGTKRSYYTSLSPEFSGKPHGTA